ncbi:helix-turn-helix domain-containing protein [Mycolicibacterium sphagni]|uniref:helix-turn-helix domain-containing protein n=1 Tax=Mycolicibacterium sphagni TaxID=1786 RepID=UPI0021F36EED|nr:helix-turn-helix domain-containing protein [Mycolicibacterium sphagni]MCV7175705.1 hypothetical protein [Mycolicibacterium sphagni]
MQTASTPVDLVGASRASAILGRSVKTVHRYISEGLLVPVGRLDNGSTNAAVVLLRSDVEELASRLNENSDERGGYPDEQGIAG